jgi:hypothetical protein
MTFQGGGFGEEGHDEAKQTPHSPEARPWEEFAPPAYAGQPPAQPEPNAPHHPPPSGPVPPWIPPTSDYPSPGYPPSGGYGPPGHRGAAGHGGPPYSPPLPQYGQSYPPPGYGGGYGGPPGYPAPYDPYQPYRDRSHETNGLAIASLVTSIAGFVVGLALTLFCFLGILGIPVPIVGAVLGVVALNQIKRTGQQGRGLAIAGIAVGVTAAVLLVIVLIVAIALVASVHSPSVT